MFPLGCRASQAVDDCLENDVLHAAPEASGKTRSVNKTTFVGQVFDNRTWWALGFPHCVSNPPWIRDSSFAAHINSVHVDKRECADTKCSFPTSTVVQGHNRSGSRTHTKDIPVSLARPHNCIPLALRCFSHVALEFLRIVVRPSCVVDLHHVVRVLGDPQFLPDHAWSLRTDTAKSSICVLHVVLLQDSLFGDVCDS